MRGFDFSGRTVLLTGGSTGIGAVTARLFAEHGADVAICARDREQLELRAAAIREQTGRRCLAILADVTDPAQVEAMVATTLAELGSIDILVNNAGGSVRSTLRHLTPEIWQQGRALNLDSAAYGIMAVGQHFIAQGSGNIVNISSVAGISGTMGEVPYSAGKAAIQMLTRVAAAEWGRYGIRVNCVAPGMTATENMQRSLDAGVYSMADIAQRFPLGRPGTCEEVAYAVLFFASDYASYITGQTLAVDGGPPISGFRD